MVLQNCIYYNNLNKISNNDLFFVDYKNLLMEK